MAASRAPPRAGERRSLPSSASTAAEEHIGLARSAPLAQRRGRCDAMLFRHRRRGAVALLFRPFKAASRWIARVVRTRPKGASHGAVSDRPPGLGYSIMFSVWAVAAAIEKRQKILATQRGANRGTRCCRRTAIRKTRFRNTMTDRFCMAAAVPGGTETLRSVRLRDGATCGPRPRHQAAGRTKHRRPARTSNGQEPHRPAHRVAERTHFRIGPDRAGPNAVRPLEEVHRKAKRGSGTFSET